MNYEDEEYVRLFTRDTVTWKSFGWEARATLLMMLKGKFDRSGVFDCEGHTPSRAVTLITDLPGDVTGIGLEEILKSGTWVLRDGKLVWPAYLHAQTCQRTDRVRQHESRKNRRAKALSSITPEPENLSQPVTGCHGMSREVTLSRAEQSLADQEGDPPVPPKPADPSKPARERSRSARPSWRRVPESWTPDAGHRELAKNLLLDLDVEVSKFRDFEFHRPKTDADATFRNWLREAASRLPAQRQPARAPAGGTRAGDFLPAQMQRIRQLEADEAAGRSEPRAGLTLSLLPVPGVKS